MFERASKKVRDIYFLLTASTLTSVLNLLKSYFVLRYLDPRSFGLIDIIKNIIALTKYGDLGFTSVVEREFNYKKAQNSPTKDLINTAYSAEIILSIILSLAVLSYAFFRNSNDIVFYGLIIASIGLLLQKLLKIHESFMRVNENFEQLSKNIKLGALVTSIGTILSVPFIGVYAALIFPVLGVLISYLNIRKISNLTVNLDINFLELIRQLKIGMSLGLLTVLSGLMIYLDRYIILKKFGLEVLGFFSVYYLINNTIQFLVKDVSRVFLPDSLKKVKNSPIEVINDNFIKPGYVLLSLVSVFVILCWIFIPPIFRAWIPNYEDSIPVLMISIPMLISNSLIILGGYILYIPTINKFLSLYLINGVYLLIGLILINFFDFSSVLFLAAFFCILRSLTNVSLLYSLYRIHKNLLAFGIQILIIFFMVGFALWKYL